MKVTGLSNYITKKGLAQRWGITKQLVHNRSIRHPDFPKPFTRTDNERTPLYLVSEIEEYEKNRGYRPIKISLKGSEGDGE